MFRSIMATAVALLPLLGVTAGAQARDAAGATSPPATTGAACLGWPMALLAARQGDPSAQVVEMMDGAKAKQFLDIVNAMPPRSNVSGDHVAVVMAPDVHAVIVVAGERDCATAIIRLPREAMDRAPDRAA